MRALTRKSDTCFVDVAAHGGSIRSEYSILYGAVALIFLISGLQLAPAKLKQNLMNWRLHVVVQGTSFLVFPTVVLGALPPYLWYKFKEINRAKKGIKETNAYCDLCSHISHLHRSRHSAERHPISPCPRRPPCHRLFTDHNSFQRGHDAQRRWR